jgi:hypothetical protein
MQSPEPPRDVDMHDGEDQGALPCHGRPGVDQSKELPSNEKEVDETLEEQAAELGATPGRGKGSPDTASTALQLALSQSPADHDTSPPEESETPRVDIQAGEDQAPLSSQELLPSREELEQLKDQLPSVEMEVDLTPMEQAAELGATPGQGKGSSDTSSTVLHLSMSQSPADQDTFPSKDCQPTRVDIQAGEDQAPVHLLDLPSVEVEVDKCTPEEPAAEPEGTPGQGKGSPAKSSSEKMPALPPPQVSHSLLQRAAWTA